MTAGALTERPLQFSRPPQRRDELTPRWQTFVFFAAYPTSDQAGGSLPGSRCVHPAAV